MKMIKFAEELVPLILSGAKTSTWRVFDDKDLQEGDDLSFVNKQSGVEFARAQAIGVCIKPIGGINESDYLDGHERFDGLDDLVTTFRKYYGEGVTIDTEVKIVKFILV